MQTLLTILILLGVIFIPFSIGKLLYLVAPNKEPALPETIGNAYIMGVVIIVLILITAGAIYVTYRAAGDILNS